MACFSGFLAGREVAKHMVARKNGTIIFTGATASIRGGSGYAAFSGESFFCIEQLNLCILTTFSRYVYRQSPKL